MVMRTGLGVPLRLEQVANMPPQSLQPRQLTGATPSSQISRVNRDGDGSSLFTMEEVFLRRNAIMGQRRSIATTRMLITGASQGIGRALAIEAVKQGAKVLAAARQISLLEELAQEVKAHGGHLEIVAADVTSEADRKKLTDAARSQLGGLDVLVNNAGIGSTGHFSDVVFN